MKFFEYLSKNIAAKVATIVIAAAIIIGGFFLLKMNPFGWHINFLGISELKIDDTANVVALLMAAKYITENKKNI